MNGKWLHAPAYWGVASTIVLAMMGLHGATLAQSQTEYREYRIGALNPITGAGGQYGAGMLAGIQLAIDEINAQGGAAGRRFSLYAEDSQTRADAAVLAAKKLVEVNKVDAVIGMWASAVTLAVMPITNEAEVIQMHSSGAPEIMRAYQAGMDMTWGFQPPHAAYGWTFAQTAQERGFTRAATMTYNGSSALGQAENFKHSWARLGHKPVAEVIYEPNQTSYRTELQRVLAAKPDVIVLAGYPPDATIILREWWQSGYDSKFIMPQWAVSPDLIKALGTEVTDGLVLIQNVPDDSANYARFVERYQQANGGQEPDIYAAGTYDEVITLALAVTAAGAGASNAQVNAAIPKVTNAPGIKVTRFAQGVQLLREGKDINYEGASSRLDFVDGFPVPDFGIFELEQGQFVLKKTIRYQPPEQD